MQMNEFYYIARLRIKRREDKENEYFGRGVADLLHGVDQFCSLNLAARHMGMAYSKAWRIVRQAEGALGIQLLHRMRKNGSTLTAEGRKMLEAYEEAEKAAWAAADAVMERYYGGTEDEQDQRGSAPEQGNTGDGL